MIFLFQYKCFVKYLQQRPENYIISINFDIYLQKLCKVHLNHNYFKLIRLNAKFISEAFLELLIIEVNS